MTVPHDPLLPYLLGELHQIEEFIGFKRRLLVPCVPLESVHGGTRTFNWSFRYTWQEVERGRRYVVPLDRDRALLAQQTAIDKILEQILADITGDDHMSSGADVPLRKSPDIQVRSSELGAAVSYVNDANALALPLSPIQRHVKFRGGLNAYSVSESIQVSRLQPLKIVSDDTVFHK